MGEYQPKESPGGIMQKHYKTVSPEKHDFFKEKMDGLFTGG